MFEITMPTAALDIYSYEDIHGEWDYMKEKRYELNPQELPVGSVAYFINTNANGLHGNWEVCYGIVDTHYSNSVVIRMIDFNRNGNTCLGIPYKEFTRSKWFKLPKGWSCHTDLITETLEWKDYEKINKAMRELDIKNPDEILRLYEQGILIDVINNDYGKIKSEVDKIKGYRLFIEYDKLYRPSYQSYYYWGVFKDYESAQKIVDKQKAALKAISEMTDEEYFFHMIDVEFKEHGFYTTEEYRIKVKEFLKSLGDYNIDIWCHGAYDGQFQWKKSNNKRWVTIPMD